MDTQRNDQQERTETAEEKRMRYMTEEERREWSGLSEWHDPLEKEKPEADPNDGKLAIASLVLGIAAVLTACIHISSSLFGVGAIVCGILSKRKGETADRMATIGIILGCICLGIALILQVFHVMGRLFPPESVDPVNIPSDLAKELE